METPKPRPKIAVPDLNPFLAIPVICPTCGDTVYPGIKKEINAKGELKTTQLANGKVTALAYVHINPQYGCSWKLEHTGERSNGQLFSIKQAELEAMKKEEEDRIREMERIARDSMNGEEVTCAIDRHLFAVGAKVCKCGTVPATDDGGKANNDGGTNA